MNVESWSQLGTWRTYFKKSRKGITYCSRCILSTLDKHSDDNLSMFEVALPMVYNDIFHECLFRYVSLPVTALTSQLVYRFEVVCDLDLKVIDSDRNIGSIEACFSAFLRTFYTLWTLFKFSNGLHGNLCTTSWSHATITLRHIWDHNIIITLCRKACLYPARWAIFYEKACYVSYTKQRIRHIILRTRACKRQYYQRHTYI